MKKINIPILVILLAFIVGILIYGKNQQQIVFASIAILASFLGVLLLHYIALKKSFSETLFLIGTFFLFSGLGYITRYRSDISNDKNHFIHYQTKTSQTLLFSITDHLKPTKYQDKFIAELHNTKGNIISGKVLLNIQKDSITTLPKIGEWYYTHTKISPLPFPKNPYQFDYGSYLKRKRIYGQLSVSRNEMLISTKSTQGIKVWSSRFRENVQKNLHSYTFTERQLAIINALLLGQKQGIDKQLSGDYTAAGMMHILAVSGLHVGIILIILRFITRFINWHKLRWVRSGIIIICIWAFAFITGLSPSVLRAATMFSFLEIGSSLGGKRSSKDAVLASGLILLIYDPLLIYQVGFQLSYLAVMAILWIQPWLYTFYKSRYYLDKLLWETATVTIAAQLGVMPLSLFYFHQFPGLFFLSNIVVLPFLTIILASGVFIVTLAMLWEIPVFIVSSYGWLIDIMNNYIQWIASQESFITRHITLSLPLLLVSYIAMIGTIHYLKKYSKTRLWIASIALILFTLTLIYERLHPEADHLAILNISRSSTLIHLENKELKIFQNDSTFSIENNSKTNAYRDAMKIRNINVDTMRNYFRFKQKKILVIDSLGIYNIQNVSPQYILLTHSPKINLNRLINRYPNTTIIADASNYKSYTQRWKRTCLEKKIPFHSTYEKGAFIIKEE